MPGVLTLERFRSLAGYDFDLDPFQVRAIEALQRDESVLVAAPTGSGKTVVAEYAVAAALAGEGRAFYTTPIKALSNQKFRDLRARHGDDAVGLLTGDNVVNGEAPIVVMTTEVLRNMIYADSPALDDLHFVVLDEVHYLQDMYRGPVWEEVIIHLDPRVRLVCLSATVSNADDLATWISNLRGPTVTVVEDRRPVELDNLYLIGDLANRQLHLVPTLVDGRANPEGSRFDADLQRRGPGRPRRRWATPRRVETVELLAERSMLPAIYFIFSRAGCDDAAVATLDAGVRLTSAEERRRIHRIVASRTAELSERDLHVLGFDRFTACLDAGVAAHHAGMVPPFKEAVEQCFTEGLVKVVYATETLALGINMPARTVVIEKLTKFTGETHEFLRPSEYTQITGRAGRRGIDEHGYAVVLWSPFVPFDQIAALAASRSFELTSAFRPNYNMAANLVARYEADEAHRLLSSSFAQFQADRDVARLERRAVTLRQSVTRLESEQSCERGDVAEYRRLLDRARERPSSRGVVEQALARLRPGDVIELPDGAAPGELVAVLSIGERRRGASRLRAVTAAGHLANVGAREFRRPPRVLARVDLPTPFRPDTKSFQKSVAGALRRRLRTLRDAARAAADEELPSGPPDARSPSEHPVHGCPDRERHLAAARKAGRLRRELADIDRRIHGRTASLVRQFDHILQILEAWEYLDGWALTDRGEQLARIFHESDLLVAEAIGSGLFDDLDPASLAGLVSCLTYEHRSATPPPEPWFPSRDLRDRFDDLDRIADDLITAEETARLPATRRPDPTFLPLTYAWVSGDDLEEVLEDDEELSGGDFVRNARQVIDLLRQVADTSRSRATATTARDAARSMHRGIVAAAAILADEPEHADADSSR